MSKLKASFLKKYLLKKPSAGLSARIKTGIQPLDKVLSGGFRPGLSVIAGGISSGKTTVSLDIAARISKSPLVISLDESGPEVLNLLKKYSGERSPSAKIEYVPRAVAEYSELLKTAADHFDKTKNGVVLINSISGTGDIYSDGRKEFFDALELVARHTGGLVLLNYETEKDMCTPFAPLPANYLFEAAEAVIFLNYTSMSGTPFRYAFLVKDRGGKSSGTTIKFEITSKTVEFIEPDGSDWGLNDNVTIKAGISYSDIKIDSFVTAEFNKTHPGIKIDLLGSPDPGRFKESKVFSQKYHIDPRYDIIQLDLRYVKEAAERGHLKPITNYFYADIQHNCYRSIIDQIDLGGFIYCMPQNIEAYCLTYRKDLYKKYGIPAPETFDELVDSLKFILGKDRSLETGLLYRQEGDGLVRVLTAHALAFANGPEDPVAGLFDLDEKYEKALKFMQDCMFKHKITNKDQGRRDIDWAERFMGGKCVCYLGSGYGYISRRMRNDPLYAKAYGMTSFPAEKKGGKRFNPVLCLTYAVPMSSKNSIYASEIIKYLTSGPIMKKVREMGNFPVITPRRDVNMELEKEAPYFDGCHQIMESSVFLDPVFKETRFRDILRETSLSALKTKNADPRLLTATAAEHVAAWKKTKYYEDSVRKAKLFMEKNLFRKLSVKDVASQVSLSPRYFEGIFKSDTGVSIGDYMSQARMQNAAEMLKSRHDLSVKQIAEQNGYRDPAYFSNSFRRFMGKSPAVYRRSGEFGQK